MEGGLEGGREKRERRLNALIDWAWLYLSLCVCVCVCVCARARAYFRLLSLLPLLFLSTTRAHTHMPLSTSVGVERIYVINAASNVEKGHFIDMVLIIHLPPVRIGIGAMREKALHKVEVPEAQIKGRLIEHVKFAITPDSNIGICAELEEQFYHGCVSDRVASSLFSSLCSSLAPNRPGS
jgi:hypothetical protein